MTTKHTPGPWRWVTVDYIRGHYDGQYGLVDQGPFDAIWSDATSKPVFVAQDASGYRATCDFPNDIDARLIAAAPELLEALIALRDDPVISGVCKSPLWAKMVNAIEKAEGRND